MNWTAAFVTYLALPGQIKSPPPAQAPALVRQLGSTSYKVRSDAHCQLRRMRRAAAPALLDGLRGEPEVRDRCERLLSQAYTYSPLGDRFPPIYGLAPGDYVLPSGFVYEAPEGTSKWFYGLVTGLRMEEAADFDMGEQERATHFLAVQMMVDGYPEEDVEFLVETVRKQAEKRDWTMMNAEAGAFGCFDG